MKTKQHDFSSAEKQMMVRSYHFFAMQKEEGLFSEKRTRELVAESIGCSPETVARVMAHYRAKDDAAFEVSVVPPAP
jgi:CRP-like cAMP-binding protein